MPGNTTQHFYDLTPLEPRLQSGQLVLTPNFRLARRIREEWNARQLDRGLASWPTAPVYALESWLLQCWQRAVDTGLTPPRVRIDNLQARELWSRVIDADSRDNGDYQLLQAGAAAEVAQQARDMLLRWQVDTAAAAARSEFQEDADCATFHRWMMAFEQRLARGSLATVADCLVDLLHSDLQPVASVVLVDFDDLQPLHEACLAKLAGVVSRHSSAAGQAAMDVCSYPDREAELVAVARWAFERQQEKPGESTGILLADMHRDRSTIEYLLRREFDCLGDNYGALPVNFSTGISLDQAPVIRDALRILASCGDELPMDDIAGLVTSRFIPLAEADQQKNVKLLQWLFEDGRQRVATARLRQAAQTVSTGGERGTSLGDALRETSGLRLRRQRLLPSAWVEPLCKVLDLWGWPGGSPLDSLEYQQVEHWHSSLESFAALDGICGELEFSAALALLQRHCQEQVSQPQTQDSNIQVLGPLEGAGLHFDAIWLCGLEGSRWPAPPRPNPFLPVGLQRRHDMPHASAEREWLYAEGLMRQYRGSCRLMRASYARQTDGIPELPSPLLAGTDISHRENRTNPPVAWVEQQATARLEVVEDNRAPAMLPVELQATAGGSGVLQDQASCPFRSFARNRLSVAPLGDYYAGLSAAQRGTLLHNALYILWGEIGDSATLHGMDGPAMAAAAERAAHAAVNEIHSAVRQQVGSACLELERKRLASLQEEWLAMERERPAFTVSAREQDLELELAGLALRLRVDRVDTLSGGETLVIDYKSGRNSLSDWLGERPAQPQLPLYGIASEVDGIAFGQVRSRDCKLLGLGQIEDTPGVQSDVAKAVKRRSDADDWASLRQQWRHNLERLAADFIRGAAEVEPLPGACNYCGLQSLCRVNLPVNGAVT